MNNTISTLGATPIWEQPISEIFADIYGHMAFLVNRVNELQLQINQLNVSPITNSLSHGDPL